MSTFTGHSPLHPLREAEVEGVADGLVLPAAPKWIALEHLEEEPGPAPCGMHLLAGDHVAGAHHPAGQTAAVPDPHAPCRRSGEAPIVVPEREVRRQVRRAGVGPPAGG